VRNCPAWLVAVVLLISCPSCTFAEQRSMASRSAVQSYIDEVSAEHALDRSWLTQIFDRVYKQQSVIDRISKPAERVLKWYQYRPIFLTDKRIKAGVQFIREHAQLLAEVESKYQVPAEIIAAIVGVETFYGVYTGKDNALSALATLAFDYPPRASFFRRELTELLLLSREERLDPATIRGSYAAAMGMPQFISSSYRAYAVDFDNDGRRDLWSSHADIIGSVANYFKQHGWRANEAIAEQVYPTDSSYKALISDNLKPKVSYENLASNGIAIDPRTDAKLSVMDFAHSENGSEVWIGYHNFYVITRYNHSRLYAMAVFQLSEALKNAGA